MELGGVDKPAAADDGRQSVGNRAEKETNFNREKTGSRRRPSVKELCVLHESKVQAATNRSDTPDIIRCGSWPKPQPKSLCCDHDATNCSCKSSVEAAAVHRNHSLKARIIMSAQCSATEATAVCNRSGLCTGDIEKQSDCLPMTYESGPDSLGLSRELEPAVSQTFRVFSLNCPSSTRRMSLPTPVAKVTGRREGESNPHKRSFLNAQNKSYGHGISHDSSYTFLHRGWQPKSDTDITSKGNVGTLLKTEEKANKSTDSQKSEASYRDTLREIRQPATHSSMQMTASVNKVQDSSSAMTNKFASRFKRFDEVQKLNRGVHVSLSEYYKICEVLRQPEINPDDLEDFDGKVFSYILQRVKFGGCAVLSAGRITSMIAKQTASETTTQRSSVKGFRVKKSIAPADISKRDSSLPVSRLDCLTYLLTHVDNTVALELFLVMAQFPMALPLVIRNLHAGTYQVTSTLLHGIVMKWENKLGKVIEHSLFNNAYKMLVAVRLGKNDKGKSSILNTLFTREYMFSTRGESQYGKPLSLEGSVEMICMLQETCEDKFWTEVLRENYEDVGDKARILLLCNLHGDANEHPDIVRFLREYFSCQFVAFVMPDCDEHEMWKTFLDNVKQDVHVIYVDDSEGVDESACIRTQDITAFETKQKVRQVIKEALRSCVDVTGVGNKGVKWEKGSGKQTKIEFLSPVTNSQSQNMSDLVSKNTCKRVKHMMSVLTNEFSYCDDSLKEIIRQFLYLLSQHSSSDLQQAVIHLDKELARLSRCEFQKSRASDDRIGARAQKDTVNKTANAETGDCRLNIQDFIRLTALLFEKMMVSSNVEMTLQWSSLLEHIFKTPEYVAKLLIEGQFIELLDGDTEVVRVNWLQAVCNSVSKCLPNLRVYVVSIIGLQSSGKSTLLNSLFACRFPVSIGRCSRGLLMRLLMLDDKLARMNDFDAILLIDTEGLGSPEKVNDPLVAKKDRLLATFAMGISNLTIINVLGESMSELIEILQIAVIAMTRLEMAGISPDIMLVQHHICEKNTDKTFEENAEFCMAIQKAVELTETKEVQVGVRNAKCLKRLSDRLAAGTHLFPFHAYKDGATANAPPSEGYHLDVVKLHETILTFGKSSSTKMLFIDWFFLVQTVWESAKSENFAFRFKNVKEVQEFIDRGQRIMEVKRVIDDAFRFHMKSLQNEIAKRTKATQQNEAVLQDSQKELEGVPFNCNNTKQCRHCEKMIKLTKCFQEQLKEDKLKEETEATLEAYLGNARKSRISMLRYMLKARILQQGNSEAVDRYISEQVSRLIYESHSSGFNESKSDIVNTVYNDVVHNFLDKSNIESITAEVKAALGKEYPQIPDFCSRFEQQLKFIDLCDTKGKLPRDDDKITQARPSGFRLSKLRCVGRSKRKPATNALKENIEILAAMVVRDRNVDYFEEAMISDVNSKLNNLLHEFEKVHYPLTAVVKISLHVWAQQQFCEYAQTLQSQWHKKNSASWLLTEREEYYKQVISTRLQLGINISSDGKLIALQLLNAVHQQAVNEENDFAYQNTKGLEFTKDSGKMRLAYYKELATAISRGNAEPALAYFENPRKLMEQWFAEKVDNHYRNEAGKTFTKTFEREFNLVRTRLSRTTSVDDFKAKVSSYVTTGSSDYGCSADGDCDLADLKSSVLNALDAGKDDWSKVDHKAFCFPSQNAEVMAMLGCTDACMICGALCWGQRGHDTNVGETKKHYTFHQPCGLSGYTFDEQLSPLQCHSISDEERIYVGSYHNVGITWADAKRMLYENWKFDRLYDVKFDELMRWFFQELHQDIASRKSVRSPTKDELQKFDCADLQLLDIMARIETVIKF